MKIFTITVLLLLNISFLSADEVGSYDEALKMAAKLNKPVLIDFWSDN
jgi:hydroxyethylthiazole kinase-like sugar kinase family protein